MLETVCLEIGSFWSCGNLSSKFFNFWAGESIISPGAKQGLLPLAIPLTKSSSGVNQDLCMSDKMFKFRPFV